MNPSDKLTTAVAETREHIIEGFEDFYVLTYKDTYADIRASVSDEESVWNILRDTYILVWKRTSNMPEANLIRQWIRILIKEVTGKKQGISQIVDFPETDTKAKEDMTIEEIASTILLKIEDQLEITDISSEWDESMEKRPLQTATATAKGMLATIITIAAVIIVVFAFRQFRSLPLLPGNVAKTTVNATVYPTESMEKQTTQEKSEESFGWNKTDKGWKYMKPDGTYAFADWLADADKLYYFSAQGYAVTGSQKISGLTCIFGESCELTDIKRDYDTEDRDNVLTAKMKELGDRESAKKVVKDSVKADGDWFYYLSVTGSSEGTSGNSSETGTTKESGNSSSKADETNTKKSTLPRLMRFSNSSKETELISDSVGGYLLIDDTIWYSHDGEILTFNNDDSGTTYTENYAIKEESGVYYLQDGSGTPVDGEGGYARLDGRLYRVDEGMIKYVKTDTQSIDGVTFVLNSQAADNTIYLSDGSEYLSEGIAINSLCVIDRYVYFSAVLSISDDNVPTSRIFRVNVDSEETEEVSVTFTGVMQNMYYYPDKNSIYMEYEPNGYTDIYGRIAVLTEDNSLYAIADNDARAGGFDGHNDTLELIMVSGNSIYCYWHDCSFDPESGEIKILSTVTLKLDDSKRELFK